MVERSARDRILDAAEARARSSGYNGFSFRDLADVGVKSASVHYHFPTKGDLAEALTWRYVDRARDILGDPNGLRPDAAIERMTMLFRTALVRDDKMCLCGLFAAERDALPAPVAAAVAAFFTMALGFLRESMGEQWNGETPEMVIARLEGALLLARSLRDPSLFEKAAGEPRAISAA